MIQSQLKSGIVCVSGCARQPAQTIEITNVPGPQGHSNEWKLTPKVSDRKWHCQCQHIAHEVLVEKRAWGLAKPGDASPANAPVCLNASTPSFLTNVTQCRAELPPSTVQLHKLLACTPG